MERVRGIEPPCAAWEAAVLPLNYTREAIRMLVLLLGNCNSDRTEAEANCRTESLRVEAKEKASPFLNIERYQSHQANWKV
jgi:hypothetical protein